MMEAAIWLESAVPVPSDGIFVSIKDAARILAISRSNIYYQIKYDASFSKLRRVGKLSRFMRDELLAWAHNQPLAH